MITILSGLRGDTGDTAAFESPTLLKVTPIMFLVH